MHDLMREEDINDVLTHEEFGHLGCCGDNIPYVFPMAFVYHGNAIYGQTKEGQKITILRNNPRVCFQVQQQQDGVWRSVLCHGTFQELEFAELRDPEEIEAVRLLTKKLGTIQQQVGVPVAFALDAIPTPLAPEGRLSTLFRILINQKTGRFYISGPRDDL
jgi:uncharacterized protein